MVANEFAKKSWCKCSFKKYSLKIARKFQTQDARVTIFVKRLQFCGKLNLFSYRCYPVYHRITGFLEGICIQKNMFLFNFLKFFLCLYLLINHVIEDSRHPFIFPQLIGNMFSSMHYLQTKWNILFPWGDFRQTLSWNFCHHLRQLVFIVPLSHWDLT